MALSERAGPAPGDLLRALLQTCNGADIRRRLSCSYGTSSGHKKANVTLDCLQRAPLLVKAEEGVCFEGKVSGQKNLHSLYLM